MTRSATRRIVHVLGRPVWRGFPMAFWLGLGALALALLWPGVRAALDAGTPGSTFARSLEDGAAGATPAAGDREGLASPAVPVVDLGGAGSGGAGSGGADPGGAGSGGAGPGGAGPAGGGVPFGGPRGRSRRAAPALSPQEVAELAALGSGRHADDGVDDTPADDGPPGDDGQPGDDRLDPGDRADSPPLDESVEPAQPDGPPPATPDAERAAREEIHAVIERQRQAVERADRELFLRDIHPSVHADARRIFDDGSAGARDIRSTIADVEIDFLDPEHAFVTFRVDVTFTVRADGRTARESTTEEWDVVLENGRWLILAWN